MTASPASDSAAVPPKRRRLKPAQRIGEVLDAALIEFSKHGFAATRMDDVARRAGLSKGGLYAHFASKEHLLEALLSRQLQPTLMAESLVITEYQSIEDMIDHFLDAIYGTLEDADTLAVIKLILTEGFRMPELMRAWAVRHRQMFIDKQKAIFDQCIAQGLLQCSALTEHPELLNTPMAMLLMARTAFGGEVPAEFLDGMRAAHRRLLTDLLRPPEQTATSFLI